MKSLPHYYHVPILPVNEEYKCTDFEEETISVAALSNILKHTARFKKTDIEKNEYQTEADCMIPGYEVLNKAKTIETGISEH
jgi:hypothetical protein